MKEVVKWRETQSDDGEAHMSSFPLGQSEL